MEVHREDEGHYPTFVIVFDDKLDPHEEVEALYRWCCSAKFPPGTFHFDLRPSEGQRLMVAFARQRDVEPFMYGLRTGWGLYKTLWLERLH